MELHVWISLMAPVDAVVLQGKEIGQNKKAKQMWKKGQRWLTSRML